MKRKGKQLYMSSEVWQLVEAEAKKRNSSTNNWIETHFLGYFLSQKIKESKIKVIIPNTH